MNIISNFNHNEISFLVYLICVNILAFILFGIDKSKAKKKDWRIKESSLLGISALGGSTGALIGMMVFKHKLSKKKFNIVIPILLIINKVVELVVFNYIK